MAKQLSENALKVLEARYLKKDKDGNVIETPDEMWHRIASAVAKAEVSYKAKDGASQEDIEDHVANYENEFYNMMSNLDFLPNSPTIMNAGRPLGQLSACFVLPVEDSMEGIFNTIRDAALIHKSGGGTGFSFSRLRPAGSTVASTGGVASGPISFMKAFDAATESVKQGGCFVAETLVLTKKGPVEIAKLQKDDEVLSINVKTGECEHVPCTDPWLTKRDVEVWSISTENGCTVVGTPDHPIMVSYYEGTNIRFKKICELEVGDPVVTMDSDNKPSYTTVIATVKQHSTRDVWNVEVPSNHNYFVCNNIRQGFFVSNTRRGANMGILRVDHPDILDFINCKNDTSTLNNFNISVAITDVFMEAVKNHTNYDLIDPHTKKAVGSLDANQVFDMIVKNAWKTGEPGIFFIDRVNQFNDLKPLYGEIESSNPCCTGDTKILTSNGEVEIQSVVDQVVQVWNGEQFVSVVPQITGTDQETIHVAVVDEYETVRKVECTLYHKFILEDGTRIEAQDLEAGMKLKPYRIPVKYAYDESIGSVIIEEYLDVKEPIVKYTRKGKVVETVYCFNEPILHQGIFNGILTGQCGEVPLLPYEVCNLGSINLLNHVNTDSGESVFDWDHLEKTIRCAVRFLDDIIDINNFPMDQIAKMARNNRKIGLGVMGWADALLAREIPYNSDSARILGKQVMSFIEDISHDESKKLAKERGTYPSYDSIAKNNPDVEPLRNNTVTCIAPTGTLSLIAGVSSGIEPVFAMAYYRNVMDGTKLPEPNKFLKDVLYDYYGGYTAEVENALKVAADTGSIQTANLPDHIKHTFVSAHDIKPEDHVLMQAAFQRYVDNAISKTVNFVHDATEEDVRTAYLLAYDSGCKGITIYRDGCRENQVLNVGTGDSKTEEKPTENHLEDMVALEVKEIIPRDRPVELSGFTRRVPIGCGKLYVTINHDENGICEIFTSNGKGGGCPSQSEATARLASIALRAGVDVKEVVTQLRGIRCPSCQRNPNVKILSCPDAIGRMLEEAQKRFEAEKAAMQDTATTYLYADDIDMVNYKMDTSSVHTPEYPSGENTTTASPETPVLDDSELKFAKNCPECGAVMEHEGGCVICRNCGWSKCN